MSDVADRLRELADELEEDDEPGENLPEHSGWQMVEEVYRREQTDHDEFVLYTDNQGDGWIRCGDSWSCFSATAQEFANAILEANNEQ